MYKRTPIYIAMTAAVFGGALAQANEPTKNVTALRGGDFALEEVVVTARKKAETLQTVPIAIAAITAQTLQEKGITSIEDIAKHTAGLSFDVGVMPNDTRPAIRGFSSSRGRSNVALLVDGVDISSETLTTAGGGTGANLGLMDLERVEVVKGPQSTTYGRSAFSGAVNYITKRPTDEVEGRVSLDADQHGRYELKLGYSTPIIEELLASSINIATTDFDGHYQNPNTGGDLGTEDTEGVAVAFSLTPSEDFSAYFRSEYSESRYAQRATVLASSTSHLNSDVLGGDTSLLGSLGENSKVLAVPGSGTTQAQCDAVGPWRHKVGGPGTPACVTVLTGDLGNANASQIDISADPLTGKDFQGTQVRNHRTSLELAWELDSVDVVLLTGYNTNDSRIQEDFDLSSYSVDSLANYYGPGSGAFVPYPGYPTPSWWAPYPGEYTQYGADSNSDTSFSSFQFSQEVRITGGTDKFDWMIDAMYWKESMDTVMNQMWWLKDGVDKEFWDAYMADVALGAHWPDPLPPFFPAPRDAGMIDHRTGPQDLAIPMSRNTDHKSIAFSVNYQLSDALRLNVEGRYMQEDIDYSSLALDTLFNGLMGMPTVDAMGSPVAPEMHFYSRTDTAFTPRIGLDWQASDELFVYGSVSEGYKPGGMTTADANGDMSSGEYAPEKLTAYEIGFKSNLLENRLQLNGAVFVYDYSDQQVSTFVTNSAGISNALVKNAGESQMTGIELETIYRPSANWTFSAGYLYSDSEYTHFNLSDSGGSPSEYDKVFSGNAEGDYTGNQFSYSAKHAANISIRFDGEFDSGASFFTELGGQFSSKRYLSLANDEYLPAYWLTDFSAGVQFDHLQTILYIDNLLDDDKVKAGVSNVSYGHLPGAQSTPASANLYLPNPRTVGIRVNYTF